MALKSKNLQGARNFDPESLVMSRKYRLNQMQRKFVLHYVDDCNLNCNKAAVAAGFAANSGSILMRQQGIRACIDDILSSLGASEAELLFVLTEILKGNPSNMLRDDGMIDMDAVRDPRNARFIKTISVNQRFDKFGNIVGIKTDIDVYSKIEAANLLMRAKGMMHDKTETTVNLDMKTLNLVYEHLKPEDRAEFITSIEAASAPGSFASLSEAAQAHFADTQRSEDNGSVWELSEFGIEPDPEGDPEGTGP